MSCFNEEMDSVSTKWNNEGDDGSARRMIEGGNMGYRPGSAFPSIRGSSRAAQILRATIGHSLKEHEDHLAAEEAKRPFIYQYKRTANRKLGKRAKLEARKYGVTEVTLDDPDILPRNMKGADFVDLYSAVACANSVRRPLNVHLTIDWKLLGIDDGAIAGSALSKLFIRHYDQWCRDIGIDGLWIYSNESSGAIGFHTHFMASVAREMLPEFKAFVAMRLKKINLLQELDGDAYKITVPRYRDANRLCGQWRQFQYLCKGVDPYAKLTHNTGETVFAADLIQFAYESPGEILSKKRFGMSRNLSKAARQRRGYRSPMELGQLNVNTLYPKLLPIKAPSPEEIEVALRALSI